MTSPAGSSHRHRHNHSQEPGHGTGHGTGQASEAMVFDAAFWDELYRSRTALWSGNPNPALVSSAAELTPGTALDVGSGEGADTIWLAERGWRVSAVDISSVALRRAAARAVEIGAEVAARIEWLHEDLAEWTPSAATYDLVSAQFMQLPSQPRATLFGRLAASVTPGGRLLVVGHDPSDMQTTMTRPQLPDLFFTAAEVADSLDPGRWEILGCEARERTSTDPEGHQVTIHDAVLEARRRS